MLRFSLLLASSLAYASIIIGAGAKAQQDCSPVGAVQFVCLDGPAEDIVAIPNSDWVLASGVLRMINTRNHSVRPLFSTVTKPNRSVYEACPGPITGRDIEEKRFRVGGLSLRAGNGGIHTLFTHGRGGSRNAVEVFEIDARANMPTIAWVGCAIVPRELNFNSVTYLPDNGLAATLFMSPSVDTFLGPAGVKGRVGLVSGSITGEVWEWKRGAGWTKVPGTEASGANGIVASQDGKWLFFSEWGMMKLNRVSRGQVPVKRDAASLTFHPDNLRLARDGSVLAAGQAADAEEYLGHCWGPDQNCSKVATSVAKIHPDTLKVEMILREYPPHDVFAAGTAAVDLGHEFWVTAPQGKSRILRVPAK